MSSDYMPTCPNKRDVNGKKIGEHNFSRGTNQWDSQICTVCRNTVDDDDIIPPKKKPEAKGRVERDPRRMGRGTIYHVLGQILGENNDDE